MTVIKTTARADGNPGYNTTTINCLTECIKLSMAVYFSYQESSLVTLRTLSRRMVLDLGVSNLMYAVNNNIYHSAMSRFDPAFLLLLLTASGQL